MDRVVICFFVLCWLIVGAADSYGPLWLFPFLWTAQGAGLVWLFRQYRHQTSPAEGQPAVGRGKPHIPLLVRLFLLPGMSHLVGDTTVRKARAIRFMRKDRWERGIPTSPEPHHGPTRMMLAIEPQSPWEVSMHDWARRHPSECSTTVHLFEPAGHWCRCGSYHYRHLPLVDPGPGSTVRHRVHRDHPTRPTGHCQECGREMSH